MNDYEKARSIINKFNAEAEEGNRNNALNRAAFSIGSQYGGDPQLVQELAIAAQQSGLPTDEVQRTSQHGVGDGLKNVGINNALTPVSTTNNIDEEQARAQAVKEAQEIYQNAGPHDQNHPYLAKKGLSGRQYPGIKQVDDELIIPLYNINDALRTIQTIDTNSKRFPRHADVKGNFHRIDGDNSIIIICEGWATGMSIHLATGYETVVAINSGNLAPVAKQIRQKYTNKRIIIAADDDESRDGLTKAEKAARLVNGIVTLPYHGCNDFNDLWVEYGDHNLIKQEIQKAWAVAEISTECTPVGAADQFIEKYNKDLLAVYVTEKQTRLFRWTGNCWMHDYAMANLKTELKQFCKSRAKETDYYIRIAKDGDETQKSEIEALKKDLTFWNKTCEKPSTAKSIREEVASHERIVIQADNLNANPWLVSCHNGVVDLRTGKLDKHRRVNRITKHLFGQYIETDDFDAIFRRSDFYRCLCDWFRNPNDSSGDRYTQDLIEFVSLWCGYCLTGSVEEEKMLYWWGKGANGKTTLALILQAVVGPYAVNLSEAALIGGERADQALIEIMGARLAFINEVGAKNSVGKMIKQLSSKDRTKARKLYEEYMSFQPTHKLNMIGNHYPTLDLLDGGVARRFYVLPFLNRVQGSSMRLDLDTALPRKEGDIILTWLIRYAHQWHVNLQSNKYIDLHGQRTGLGNIPDVASQYTRDYLRSQEPLSEYLSEACDTDDLSYKVQASELLKHHKQWCEESKVIGLRDQPKKFYAVIRTLPYVEPYSGGPNKDQSWYRGIRPKASVPMVKQFNATPVA